MYAESIYQNNISVDYYANTSQYRQTQSAEAENPIFKEVFEKTISAAAPNHADTTVSALQAEKIGNIYIGGKYPTQAASLAFSAERK